MSFSATPHLTALTMALSAVLPASGEVLLNGFAATVNGTVITRKEVAFQMAPIVGLIRAKYPRRGENYHKEMKAAQDDVLDRLIENKLVLSELGRRGAALPNHVIDAEVKRIVSEVFQGDETKFRESLKETGMTMRGFKESQREKILVQAFRSQQFDDVAPATPEEISAHYQKRRLKLRDRSEESISFQKIFILSADPARPGFTPEDQLNFAEQLAEQLKNGADFTELAKEHSAGAFADEGGLWPDEARADLAPAFAEVIFDAPENTIIGPLKDPAGFMIVKVTKKNFGPIPPLGEVRDRMRQEVEIEKRSSRYKKWIETLKRNSMIDRRI